jgi:hypothetical protein
LIISFLYFSTHAVLNFINWNFCFIFLDWLFEAELWKGADEMADVLVGFINKNLTTCAGSLSKIHLIQYCSYNNTCRPLSESSGRRKIIHMEIPRRNNFSKKERGRSGGGGRGRVGYDLFQ